MSLLSINRSTVLLLADAIHTRTHISGQAPQRHTHAWSEDASVSLQGVLDRTQEIAAGVHWQTLQVLIADHHVHYSVVPAVDVALTPNEQLAYTQAFMVQTWGESAQTWPFRLLRFPAAQANLLATMPQLTAAVLQSTPSTLKGLRKMLFQPSAKPYASALLALAPRPDHAVILVPEHQVMRLFVFNQGDCVHVSSTRLEVSQLASLLPWIQREQALHGASQAPCQVLVEPSRHTLIQALKAWQATTGPALPLQIVYPRDVLFDWSAS